MSQKEIVNDKKTKKPLKKLIEVDDDDVKVVKNVVGNADDNCTKVENCVNGEEKKSPKKKKKPPCKNEIFKKEQGLILDKFHKITKFDGKMTMFYTDDISEEDRKIINDLVDDIKKFYKAIVWQCADNEDSEKVWILLLKSVYKHTGHKVTQFIDRKVENKVVIKKMRIIIEKETDGIDRP